MIGDEEVAERVNFMVLGTKESRRNRKVPGAKRWTDNDTGDFYSSGYRYYTKGNIRKTFAFNNGLIYFVSDNGAETADTNPFAATAVPCWESIRVSSNDVLYFSEGVNTGMYSHDGNLGNAWAKESAVTLNFVGMLGHLDRLFGFQEDSEDLYFSKNLVPTNFTDSTDAGLITIGPKRGSKIMAIALLYGTLYIFKQDSIWKLSGRSPAEFEVTEVHPTLGCAGRHSVANGNGGIFLLGSDLEYYFFQGTIDSTIKLTDKLLMAGDLTKNLSPLINPEKVDNCRAIFHNGIYICAFTKSGDTNNNHEYCFNTVNETDYITEGFHPAGYIKLDRNPDENYLLTCRRDIGHIMQRNFGLNTDSGESSPKMAFRLQTKAIGMVEPRNIRFKRAYFKDIEQLGSEPITCRYYVDSRTAVSDAGSDQWPIIGEQATVIGSLKIAKQKAITSRVNLDYGKAKGQNISFAIDHEGSSIDFGFGSISLECVVKSPKKSKVVGV